MHENSPCYCGSRRKFKKCCGARGGGISNQFFVAAGEANPSLGELISKVRAFFDRSFSGTIQQGLTSDYVIGGDKFIDRASVSIVTRDPDRAFVYLAHELLHLDLHARGYGIYRGWPGLAPKVANAAQAFKRDLEDLVNQMHHLIFFEQFVEMGFPPALFVLPVAPPQDYSEFSKIHKAMGFPELHGFLRLWWAHEAIRHYLAPMQGQPDESRKVDIIIGQAMSVFHDFDCTWSDIVRWVDNGGFKKPEGYIPAFNNLATILAMPRPTFASIDPRTLAIQTLPL
ncbi:MULTISPECIES: SEC-C domain-containing protein [unclassified Rhizobium]|uniref:YecA family protein n=1 Tax=unclassified Rhizobium TaxID=2613769 RepID=UPI001B34170E|nr:MULTISPECIES: SEC-C domain-containing protein [unclassified Rhizobium]MBX5256001.1 SEC-C domain-containing protein [Rhizobium sp. NLR16b]MBX5262096.1 SEC-C domain-containing protein [Rhizobium sp. NLR16a]MBX5310662.1 SEC-C domain-containing protein [Rhizobium sp. NLR11b]QTU98313.1 SEC-C domain-containing protein [Rhizobium sp. NLR16a]